VISSSPTDVQPVFSAIAENSVRLCNAIAEIGGGLVLPDCVDRDQQRSDSTRCNRFTARTPLTYLDLWLAPQATPALTGSASFHRPAVPHRVGRASHRQNRQNPRGGLVGSSPRLLQGFRGTSGPDSARSGMPVGAEPRDIDFPELRLRGLRSVESLKSVTRATTWHGGLGSLGAEILRIPDCPDKSAAPNLSLPIPFGATTPRPVITTRRRFIAP